MANACRSSTIYFKVSISQDDCRHNAKIADPFKMGFDSEIPEKPEFSIKIRRYGVYAGTNSRRRYLSLITIIDAKRKETMQDT